MATGRSNKLVGQVGEFLVCAELGRRGLIATPFSGNVPGYDVIATNEDCRSIPIQVKANNGGKSWQFSATKYLKIEIDSNTKVQTVHGYQRGLFPDDLVFVFVRLGLRDGAKSDPDRFFILEWKDLRKVMVSHYRLNLKKFAGRRPRNPESTHMALFLPELEPFKDGWEVIEKRLRRPHRRRQSSS